MNKFEKNAHHFKGGVMKKTQHFEVINKDGLFGHDEKTTTTKPTK